MLLTIAIPTYNRAEFLKETFSYIVPQLTDEVEILISDNASTDNTKDIVKDFPVSYFRNDSNVGPDKNFNLAIRRAKGKYVWLFGDDDKILPGTVEYVLESIKKYKDLSMIFINWSVYDKYLEKCILPEVNKFNKDKYFKESNDFLSFVSTNAMFMSACIIKKYDWLNINEQKYIGSNWMHFGGMFEASYGKKSLYIGKPLVINRSGNNGWETDNPENVLKFLFIKLPKILEQLRNIGYSEKSIYSVLVKLQKRLINVIKAAKKRGMETDMSLIKELFKYHYNSIKFWIFGIPLLLIPNSLYISILKIFNKQKEILVHKEIETYRPHSEYIKTNWK